MCFIIAVTFITFNVLTNWT